MQLAAAVTAQALGGDAGSADFLVQRVGDSVVAIAPGAVLTGVTRSGLPLRGMKPMKLPRRSPGWAPVVVGGLTAVCVAGGGIWWAVSASAPVPPDEAMAFAAALQDDVLRGDLEAVCDVAVSVRLCAESLEEYRERVPVERARAVCTWALKGSEAQVVVLTGVDGSGAPYVNDMPVLRDGRRLISSSSVYWRNYGVPNANPVTADADSGPPAPVCR